jgi:glycogen operon protein
MLISGDAADVVDSKGEPVRDETFLLLLNAHFESIPFLLPGEEHLEWELILDTATEEGFLSKAKKFPSGDDVDLRDRSACLLRLTGGEQPKARTESWRKRLFKFAEVSAEEERTHA